MILLHLDEQRRDCLLMEAGVMIQIEYMDDSLPTSEGAIGRYVLEIYPRARAGGRP